MVGATSTTSAASQSIMDRTCLGKAPASRRLVKSRRRPMVEIAKVLQTAMAVNTRDTPIKISTAPACVLNDDSFCALTILLILKTEAGHYLSMHP